MLSYVVLSSYDRGIFFVWLVQYFGKISQMKDEVTFSSWKPATKKLGWLEKFICIAALCLQNSTYTLKLRKDWTGSLTSMQ